MSRYFFLILIGALWGVFSTTGTSHAKGLSKSKYDQASKSSKYSKTQDLSKSNSSKKAVAPYRPTVQTTKPTNTAPPSRLPSKTVIKTYTPPPQKSVPQKVTNSTPTRPPVKTPVRTNPPVVKPSPVSKPQTVTKAPPAKKPTTSPAKTTSPFQVKPTSNSYTELMKQLAAKKQTSPAPTSKPSYSYRPSTQTQKPSTFPQFNQGNTRVPIPTSPTKKPTPTQPQGTSPSFAKKPSYQNQYGGINLPPAAKPVSPAKTPAQILMEKYTGKSADPSKSKYGSGSFQDPHLNSTPSGGWVTHLPDSKSKNDLSSRVPTQPGTTPTYDRYLSKKSNYGNLTSGDRLQDGVRPYVPDPPGRTPRPAAPVLSQQQQVTVNNFNTYNVNWNQNNVNVVNDFSQNRVNQWNHITNYRNNRDWSRSYGTADYRDWRRDTWHFRSNRCRETWYRTAPYHYYEQFFNRHWYNTCWWRSQQYNDVYVERSPWWWWRPVIWSTITYFFDQRLTAEPIIFDPGTNLIISGEVVYLNGQLLGNARDYRLSTIILANPDIQEIPIPEPPSEEPKNVFEYLRERLAEASNADQSDTEQLEGDWLPAGVWALTQQEQGDATMFFQFSINKDGLVAGAYKNVMTGDEQPIVGQVDFENQRIAWHVGEVTTTVYETGLSNLENDVASIFVHFGADLTQEWLMVRMPSPEMPPETIRMPEYVEY